MLLLAQQRLLINPEALGEPIEHILFADGRVIVLAMLRPGLLLGEKRYGHVHAVLFGVLRLLDAEDVMAAVNDKVRALNVPEHALEREVLAFLECHFHGLRAENPLDMTG